MVEAVGGKGCGLRTRRLGGEIRRSARTRQRLLPSISFLPHQPGCDLERAGPTVARPQAVPALHGPVRETDGDRRFRQQAQDIGQRPLDGEVRRPAGRPPVDGCRATVITDPSSATARHPGRGVTCPRSIRRIRPGPVRADGSPVPPRSGAGSARRASRPPSKSKGQRNIPADHPPTRAARNRHRTGARRSRCRPTMSGVPRQRRFGPIGQRRGDLDLGARSRRWRGPARSRVPRSARAARTSMSSVMDHGLSDLDDQDRGTSVIRKGPAPPRPSRSGRGV